MDPIKEAFDKIKQDILSLKNELTELKQTITELNNQLLAQQSSKQTDNQTIPAHNPTNDHPPISTPAHFPTNPTILEPLYPQNLELSTGNRGVPTDKSTDRQTAQQTDRYSAIAPTYPVYEPKIGQNEGDIRFSNPFISHQPTDDFERAKRILDSLDTIKRDIRLKFKRLTPQEMQVFTILYALEEQNFEEITYKILAQRLNLTESSIRDYVTKLVSKGIPILKVRQNNKKITLSVSKDLQRVATLATILKLREI